MGTRTWITDADGNRCSVEFWVHVRGFSGHYEISNQARIRSVDRINTNREGVVRQLRGKQLRLSVDSEGYLQVGLLKNGQETKARVHRLLAEAFIPNPLALPVVDHRDRDRTNNAISNLRWASFSLNRVNCSPAKLSEAEKASAVQ